jgi:hypothetical protein
VKFTKIIGEIDSKEKEHLVNRCQGYLSEVFAELSTGWNMNLLGSKVGGDPLLMQLVAPMPHYCDITGIDLIPLRKAFDRTDRKDDLNLPLNEEDLASIIRYREYKKKYPQIVETAATDGKVFYWAPQFVTAKSKLGVRCLVGHEGMHAALLHPNRRGHRIPSLWNISIDFKANFNTIDDLRQRGFKRPEVLFKELADYVTLEDYAQFVRDPYNPPEKMLPFSPRSAIQRMLAPDYVDSNYVEPTVLYAEPNLHKDMSQPEVIYDHLMRQVPRCDECGKLFCYKVPEDVQEMKRKLKKIQEHNAKEYGTGKKVQV